MTMRVPQGMLKAGVSLQSKSVSGQKKATLRLESGPKLTCNRVVPPAPANILGTCDYYLWRVQSFKDRHVDCSHVPPDYYLDYGYKYCMKFGTELEPSLSPEGKAWLARARLLLQKYMETGLQKNMKEDKKLELDAPRFRKFAFDTHPDAYWDAGLADVPFFFDKFKIVWTPDLKEWADGDTWVQAGVIVWRLTKHNTQAISQEVVDYFKDVFGDGDQWGGGSSGGGGPGHTW